MPTPRPNGHNNDLRDKHILFVNSGGKKKRFTLERARQLGMRITLLNASMDVPASLCDTFIQADTYNHKEVSEKLHRHFKANPQDKPDGAITFWEDDVPLLGKICEEFHLPGNTYDTAIMTRDKHVMRKRLSETGLGGPQFHLIVNQSDLRKAMKTIGFPAVMKPVWGADSEFVILVQSEEEVRSTYAYLQKNCNEKFNPIFKYNRGLFLYEEYMEGTEVSVEGFAQYGIPHVIGINEKQPIKLPYFVEFGDIAPARIEEDTAYEVNKLAESAMIALGVHDSLAHIEIKITPEGPKIVEVGSRMGGDDIYFNVRNVWGIDLVETGLQIALGHHIPPRRKMPKDCVICRYFIPQHSGIISTIQQDKRALKSKDLIHLTLTKDVGDAVLVPPEGFENAGWVVVRGKTYQQAETLLEKIMRSIDINVTKFHRDSSLGRTTRENSLDTASVVRSKIMEASRLAKLRSADLKDVRRMHIGILSNSSSSEIIRRTLVERGFRVGLIDVSEAPLPIRKIQNADFDFVLNLCEASLITPLLGTHVAALLEMLQLPFSGSSPITMGTALDKITVKKLLDYQGIPTPEWDYVEDLEDTIGTELRYPLMVKPARADDYHGIRMCSVVETERELKKQLAVIVEEYHQPALIEEYIDGDEIDACILGSGEEAEVLPIIRSVFDKMPEGYWHIFSSDLWETKHAKALNAIRIEKPARISPKLNKLVSEMALDMFHLFDCRDYAEVELRIDKEGNPFVLEINPNPGIDPTDFLPAAAKLAGYNYGEFLESIIWSAIQRYKDNSSLMPPS